MIIGEKLHLRLFLEGLEVPVVSAVCNAQPNTASIVSIQIPSVASAFRFHPRTLVHLFFYSANEEDVTELDKYKLLFVGEIVGFSAQKTPMGIGVVLQCMDHSNYWDSTYMFNATGLGKQGKRLSNFVGANTSVVSSSSGGSIFPDSKGTSGYSKVASILQKSPASFPKMQGLLAGIIHLLESIGGFYRGSDKYKGFNDFTSLAELRLKLMQQIHASQEDTTSAKLFDKSALKKWIKQTIGAKGSMSSFNDVSKKLMQFIFHQRHPIFAPPYLPEGETEIERGKTKVEEGLNIKNLLDDLAQITHFRRPNFESAYVICMEFHRITKHVRRECSSLSKEERGKGHKRNAAILGSAGVILFKAARKSEYMVDYWKRGVGRSGQIEKKNVYGITLPDPNIMFKSPVNSRESEQYVQFLVYISRAMATLLPLFTRFKGVTEGDKYKDYIKKYINPARLGVQLFLPDLYFSPPPRCNVIFPEYYDRLNFSRSYLQEPTRLMLKGGSNRSGDIFGGGYSKMGVYFAPDVPSMRGNVKMSSKKFARTMMPHELYTGIIPQQAMIPWAKVYKIDTESGGKKYPYIQRLTNFEYAKRRFGSRQMAVGGQFNWRPVPGFPIMIITGAMSESQLKVHQQGVAEDFGGSFGLEAERMIKENSVGAHYIGYLQGIKHTLNQQGGRTDYVINMVRNQWELSDALSQDKLKVKKKVGTKKGVFWVLESDIAQIAASKVGKSKGKVSMDGPNGVKITEITEEKKKPIKGRTYWQYQTKKIYPNPVLNVAGQANGDIVVKLNKPKWTRVKWEPSKMPSRVVSSAYVLKCKGDVPIYKEEEKDVPVEAALTPPWLDKVWHSSQINDTYQKMLGTTSVLEGVGLKADKSKFEWAIRSDAKIKSTARSEAAPSESAALNKSAASKESAAFKKSAASKESAALANEGMTDIIISHIIFKKNLKEAVNHLVLLYTYAKRGDVYSFIKEYTKRPVANFEQIFGSQDFELGQEEEEVEKVIKKKKSAASKYDMNARPETGDDSTSEKLTEDRQKVKYKQHYYKVKAGKEGFHSRAVSDIDDLFSLVDEGVDEVLRLSRRDEALLAKMDTRKEKRERVRDYLNEIMFYSIS